MAGLLTLDGALGVLLLFVVVAVGAGAVFFSVNKKFPRVKIYTRYRGTAAVRWFRLRGKMVIADDIIGIMLNNYTMYCDNIANLSYSLQPNGTRLYEAVLREDYLIGLFDKDKNKGEMLKTQPVIKLDKKETKTLTDGTLRFGNSLLVPITVEYTNEKLEEKQITTGKSIAIGFIQAEEETSEFIKTTNPIMAVLISALPMIIMGLLFCLMFYVIGISQSNNILQMTESAQKILEAAEKLR